MQKTGRVSDCFVSHQVKLFVLLKNVLMLFEVEEDVPYCFFYTQ